MLTITSVAALEGATGEEAIMDRNEYLSVPLVDSAASIALANELLARAPGGPATEGVRRSLAQLHSATALLFEAWKERTQGRDTPAVTARTADIAMDRAWRGLALRLEGASELDPEHAPQSIRAAQLYEALFPCGMSFLNYAYRREWAESERLLAVITAESYDAELDDICGREYLAGVRRAHSVYGRVLGITEAPVPETAAPDLLILLRGLRSALADYALQIVASIDWNDEEAVAAVEARLAPIVEERSRRRGSFLAAPTQEQDGEGEGEEATATATSGRDESATLSTGTSPSQPSIGAAPGAAAGGAGARD